MLIKYKKCPNCGTYYEPTLEKCPHCYKHNELYLNREISTSIAYLHPFAQLGLFLAGFSFVGMLLIQLTIFYIIDSFDLSEGVVDAIINTGTYLILLLTLASIVFFTRRKYFFSKYKRGIDYIYGIGYAVTLILMGSLIGNFISIFHETSDNINQTAAVSYSHNYPILAFFILGIVGPVCEELTYRVGLYSFLRRINKYLAIGVSAVIFALIHFSFKQDAIINELWSLPSYLVSGVILALAYEHRGPACSMVAHILYNIFAFILILAV